MQIDYKGQMTQVRIDQSEAAVAVTNIEERSSARLLSQQIRDQENIEAIVGVAARELDSVDQVPDVDPDKDWTTRFFRCAADVSSEQMQDLWGRVLAGKLKRPQGYSLRTLEALRNMTKEEAEAFSRVADEAILGAEGVAFVFRSLYLPSGRGSYDDILVAKIIGAAHDSSGLRYEYDPEDQGVFDFVIGSKVLRLKLIDKACKLDLYVYLFTPVGRDLLRLGPAKSNAENIEEFILALKKYEEHCSVSTATVFSDSSSETSKCGEFISYESFEDLLAAERQRKT
ncbi:DUF2806 domain-containing protein [Rhodopirellula europaea]|uniref:DUF2806 domain-containing protein n=1 Tax=Rhodopirellula europaea TaxID=1263866 RepID=UPI003D2DDD9E|tara:strand:- start:23699 stop:24553 length:855 start_codon:yes stop_codon:yes gene_type:complete